MPEGTQVARFGVDAAAAGSDIDLTVYRVVGQGLRLVGQSATSGGDEAVTLTRPEPGPYVLAVRPYADPKGATSSPYTASRWLVAGAAGNLAVGPAGAKVTAGKPVTLTVAWTGLTPGRPYLGWIGYPGGAGTVVAVTA